MSSDTDAIGYMKKVTVSLEAGPFPDKIESASNREIVKAIAKGSESGDCGCGCNGECGC